MALTKRNKSVLSTTPYGYHPHISVYYEMKYGSDTITIGDKIKFKYQRSVFIFKKYVHNSQLQRDWIDCMDEKTGEWRSFYVDDLRGKVKPKRKRRKIVQGT